MANAQSSDSSGFNRDHQRQILKRFLQITLGRLARMRDDLSDEQQLFLDALPVMLHTNHPDFPCFVSDYAPCGICKYQMSGAELQKVHGLAPNLTLEDAKNNKEQILGLYITGDCGTIIESPQQNLIVWVCHTDSLGANEISHLNRKCSLIEDWAKSLNLAVKFRVFDTKFVSAQKDAHLHYIELDLFYRTSILVAGRMPLWWLIPPEEEHRYDQFASILRHKNFVEDKDVIDFGGIVDIPVHEYIISGIELLSYSFATPYETCIKQLITEIYISERPETLLLSRQFKQAVYDDKLDLDTLDPYVMVYKRIDSYLSARQEINRIELIRRCFYYQVGKHLSQYSSQSTWQRKLMESMVDDWKWSKEKLKELDNRNHWRASKVKEERLELVRELTASYRFLLEFARRNREAVYQYLGDVHTLGRKLYSWYERKAGKVDRLNLDITPNLEEENLHFCQVRYRLKTVWAVYSEPVSNKDAPTTLPLRRSESLVELIAWCYFNGLATGNTRLEVTSGEHQLSNEEVRKIYETLKSNIPSDSKFLQTAHDAFDQPATPSRLQMFINVGVDPAVELKKRDKRPLGGLTNIFDFSGKKDNVILNIETLSVNSWGEITCKRFEGSIALLNCINDFMQSVPPDTDINPPQVNIHSFSSLHANSTARRMSELFRDITACYYSSTSPSNTRYILQMKNQFFIIQYEHGKTQFKGARNVDELIKRLGQNQSSYSPIIFDRHAMSQSALEAICPTMIENTVQVYFEDNKNGTASVYVIDEKGSVLHFTQGFRGASQLLNPIDTFIQSTLYRQSAAETFSSQDKNKGKRFIETQVLYYEIKPPASQDKPYKVIPFELENATSARHDAFSVQAIAELGEHNKPVFNLYCDQQEFSAADWGQGLYPTVARFILSRRKSGDDYPCYVSDLDLSSMDAAAGTQQKQTIDYLRYKLDIDLALNTALDTHKEITKTGKD